MLFYVLFFGVLISADTMSKRRLFEDNLLISKQQRLVDYTACIICQSKTEEPLVEAPKTHEKVLDVIRERAGYSDCIYPEVFSRLSSETSYSLFDNNATWHRSCYQNTVNKTLINRAKERFRKDISKRRGVACDEDINLNKSFTRSSTKPYEKDVCIFCQKCGTKRFPLHQVATMEAGKNLKTAIEKGTDAALKVRLSTSIDPSDAHALDVMYHKNCWTTSVSNALREKHQTTDSTTTEIAAEIEFLTLVEDLLNDGHILSIATLQKTLENIRQLNGVPSPDIPRKSLKRLLINEIADLEFSKPPKVNEAERVFRKATRAKAIFEAEKFDESIHMKDIYNVSMNIRKRILSSEPWHFSGSFNEDLLAGKYIPSELYCLFRWIISGPERSVTNDSRCTVIDSKAMALSQNTMFACLSAKQVAKPSTDYKPKHTKEWPLQLAVGATVHQATRSKRLIDFLHAASLSVDYKRVLRLENQIANQVIREINQSNGFFVPPDFVKGRHVFFAIDNCDFAEDTPDGKRTLHGTAMALYQRKHKNDSEQVFRIHPDVDSYQLDKLPAKMTEVMPCPVPANSKPDCPVYPLTEPLKHSSFSQLPHAITDITWLLAKSVCRKNKLNANTTEPRTMSIPTWNAYNSCIGDGMPLTAVATPPILTAPAHEWSTLFTVLTQAQGINNCIVGEGRRTVITLDMGLFKPATQLVMQNVDFHGKYVLRPGELHIVMAMLRTIGSYIENSGLDSCWVEANMYSSTTCKQIIDGGHVKRAVEAHTVTLLSLFGLYAEELFNAYPTLLESIQMKVEELDNAFEKRQNTKLSHAALVSDLVNLNIMSKIEEYDKQSASNPMSVVIRQYMEMVSIMLQFIRSFHTGNWELHLQSLEIFTKYFFALDKSNYARMIPLYLAEMRAIKEDDPELWTQFCNGNWVVNKNEIPFCAIGADHALEHINRWMKVSGGIVGITLNDTARSRFFLVSPQLSHLVNEASDTGNRDSGIKTLHHQDNRPCLSRQDKNVVALTEVMRTFTNPFGYEGEDVINIVTKEVMTEGVKTDLMTLSEKGQHLHEQFLNERIRTNEVGIWAVLKKNKLRTWKESCKRVKITANKTVVELREDRGLFARILIAARSRPEVNAQEVIAKYELSVIPRALFSSDGNLLHCSVKSQLMGILENMAVNSAVEITDETCTEDNTTAVVDGMVEVQAMGKPHWVKHCSDLAEHFLQVISRKYLSKYNEVHLVFDRYDVPKSLKDATRQRRLGKKESVAYHIADHTNLTNVSLVKFLSHSSTKDELSTYLSIKALEYATERKLRLVCAWRDQARSTFFDAGYLASSQEEADTKLVLHALDATQRGTSNLFVHSLDTDVFVLFLRRYPRLPKCTKFCTGTGNRQREIDLGHIYGSLSPLEIEALPGFHAFSGADNTGTFSGKGKLSFWKAFRSADESVKRVFANLGKNDLTEDMETKIEQFTCSLYCPKTTITDIGHLRWWMFKQKQAEAEKLPPTKAALKQSILRTQLQAIIWFNDDVVCPALPSPIMFGWKEEIDSYVPIMTSLPPAPTAMLELILCKCKTSLCSSNKCKCKSNNLFCTELCQCEADDDTCENTPFGRLMYENNDIEEIM